MNITKYTINKKKVFSSPILVPKIMNDFTPNFICVKKLVVAINNNKRQATAKVKTRGEVRGGGKKPWRQKGTGNARHSSTRSPIWRGGGVVFGPTGNENYKIKINKKEKKIAIKSAWNIKLKQKKISVIENLKMDKISTKNAFVLCDELVNSPFYLFVTSKFSSILYLSFRNLVNVEYHQFNTLSVNKILKSNHIIMSVSAWKELNKYFEDNK